MQAMVEEAFFLHYWKSRQYVAGIAFSSSQFFVTLFAARNEPLRR